MLYFRISARRHKIYVSVATGRPSHIVVAFISLLPNCSQTDFLNLKASTAKYSFMFEIK